MGKAKRITIMLDNDLDKKLRLMQGKIIAKDNISCSFSRVINDTIRKSLK